MRFYPSEPEIRAEKETYVCRIVFSSYPVLVYLAGILLVNAVYIILHHYYPNNPHYFLYQILLLIWVIFFYFLFHTVFSVLFSRITITNRQIFGRRFAFRRIHFVVRLQDIKKVTAYTFGFGRLFDYGVLRIKSAGQSDYWLFFVKSPTSMIKKILDDLCLPYQSQGGNTT